MNAIVVEWIYVGALIQWIVTKIPSFSPKTKIRKYKQNSLSHWKMFLKMEYQNNHYTYTKWFQVISIIRIRIFWKALTFHVTRFNYFFLQQFPPFIKRQLHVLDQMGMSKVSQSQMWTSSIQGLTGFQAYVM